MYHCSLRVKPIVFLLLPRKLRETRSQSFDFSARFILAYPRFPMLPLVFLSSAKPLMPSVTFGFEHTLLKGTAHFSVEHYCTLIHLTFFFFFSLMSWRPLGLLQMPRLASETSTCLVVHGYFQKVISYMRTPRKRCILHLKGALDKRKGCFTHHYATKNTGHFPFYPIPSKIFHVMQHPSALPKVLFLYFPSS